MITWYFVYSFNDSIVRINIEYIYSLPFQGDNKLHVDIVKCPSILSARLVAAFPHQLLEQERVHVIRLSYDHYTDKIKGKLDVYFDSYQS